MIDPCVVPMSIFKNVFVIKGWHPIFSDTCLINVEHELSLYVFRETEFSDDGSSMAAVVGFAVGASVSQVGFTVGAEVGESLAEVGAEVGVLVAVVVGAEVGILVGPPVGAYVSPSNVGAAVGKVGATVGDVGD
jgi:hypothetical protein|tara:strand:- start:1869 stop:2270 length:402 start_codon:yes stop_codon:yes gene_type:complete